MATRDDVARLAGVSASTVSYVISGQRTISQATRDKVQRAMRELDYTPNAFARGLAGSQGKIFALHYPYSPLGLSVTEFEYVAAAANAARIRGYHLMLWSNPAEDLDGLRSLVNENLVDGVILMEVEPSDARIALLAASKTPFVTIGRPMNQEGVNFVDDDFEALVRLAVDHLADQGHESIAFLHSSAEAHQRGRGPLRRIATALDDYGRRRKLHVADLAVPQNVAGGHQAFAALGRQTQPPTAVIAFNEAALPGLIAAAAAARVHIPDELAIVALSVSDSVAEATVPPLTTVSPPAAELAQRAVEILTDMVQRRTTRLQQDLVTPRLTVRASSTAEL